MKHFLLIAALFAGVTLFAADAAKADAAKTDTAKTNVKTDAGAKAAEPEDWDFISLTFIEGIPEAKNVVNVYGVKAGLPIGFGGAESFVSGVEASVIGSMTNSVYGVQTAILFCDADFVCGLQASFIFNYAKLVSGLQFSVVNYAKEGAVQIGLVNIIEDSPVTFFPFVNFY